MKKNMFSKSLWSALYIICGDDAKIGAEQNVQLSFYNRVQQKHIMKSHVYICSGEVEGTFPFVFVIHNFSLHHTQVLQMKYFVLPLMFPFVPGVFNHRWMLADTLQFLVRCNGERRFKDMKGHRYAQEWKNRYFAIAKMLRLKALNKAWGLQWHEHT